MPRLWPASNVLVIVGHGPSIVGKGLGSWIDQQTVVRLKDAPRPDPADWGRRIDYQCASTPLWPHLGVETWVLPNRKEIGRYECCANVRVAGEKWWEYFDVFYPTYKMSTGLRAIFCAAEFLKPEEICLVGFDKLMNPASEYAKWKGPSTYLHDAWAEHRAAFQLGIRLFEPQAGLCGLPPDESAGGGLARGE